MQLAMNEQKIKNNKKVNKRFMGFQKIGNKNRWLSLKFFYYCLLTNFLSNVISQKCKRKGGGRGGVQLQAEEEPSFQAQAKKREWEGNSITN